MPNSIVEIVNKNPIIIVTICILLLMLKDQIIKLFPGVAKAFLKQKFNITLSKKKQAKNELPNTDLSKILSDTPPWTIAISCNFEEICFVHSVDDTTKQIVEFVNKQKEIGIQKITFNLMKTKKIDENFAVSIKKACFRILADNNIFVMIVIPSDCKSRIKKLKQDIDKIIAGSSKSTIYMREGRREDDKRI